MFCFLLYINNLAFVSLFTDTGYTYRRLLELSIDDVLIIRSLALLTSC